MSAFALTSPFAKTQASTSSSSTSGSANDDVEYAIVRRADVHVDASEIERSDRDVVEVQVRWGRTVIGLAHVQPGASFAIGDSDDVDVTIPQEKLGVSRWELIVGGKLIVPAGASAIVDESGQKRQVEGGQQIAMTRGLRVRVSLGGVGTEAITIAVSQQAAGIAPKSHRRKLGALAIIAGISVAAHLAAVTAISLAPGDSLDADDAGLDRATAAYMTSLSKNQMDRERAEEEREVAETKGEPGGQTGAAHRGTSGMMGRMDAPKNGGAYAIAGPPETRDQHMARTRALIESGNYGAIGALASVFGNSGPIDAASSFESSLGNRPLAFEGNLVGDKEGDAYGFGGLGLLGTSTGGNGFSDGLGLGRVGGFGHDDGEGGLSYGRCEGAHCGRTLTRATTKAPRMIEPGGDEFAGGLPREVVQRIVRANFPRLRACYEGGLRRDPGLRGTVSTRFIIDATGAVEHASLAGGSMSDKGVSACVVGVFGTMSFPEPSNGKAMVTYPVSFDNE